MRVRLEEVAVQSSSFIATPQMLQRGGSNWDIEVPLPEQPPLLSSERRVTSKLGPGLVRRPASSGGILTVFEGCEGNIELSRECIRLRREDGAAVAHLQLVLSQVYVPTNAGAGSFNRQAMEEETMCVVPISVDIGAVKEQKILPMLVHAKYCQIGVSFAVSPADAEGYKARLGAFLEAKNPDAMQHVPRIVEKVSEIDVFTKLRKKHGVCDYGRRIRHFLRLYRLLQSNMDVATTLEAWEMQEEELIRKLVVEHGPEAPDIDRGMRIRAFQNVYPAVPTDNKLIASEGEGLSENDFEAAMAELVGTYGPEPSPSSYLFPAAPAPIVLKGLPPGSGTSRSVTPAPAALEHRSASLTAGNPPAPVAAAPPPPQPTGPQPFVPPEGHFYVGSPLHSQPRSGFEAAANEPQPAPKAVAPPPERTGSRQVEPPTSAMQPAKAKGPSVGKSADPFEGLEAPQPQPVAPSHERQGSQRGNFSAGTSLTREPSATSSSPSPAPVSPMRRGSMKAPARQEAPKRQSPAPSEGRRKSATSPIRAQFCEKDVDDRSRVATVDAGDLFERDFGSTLWKQLLSVMKSKGLENPESELAYTHPSKFEALCRELQLPTPQAGMFLAEWQRRVHSTVFLRTATPHDPLATALSEEFRSVSGLTELQCDVTSVILSRNLWQQKVFESRSLQLASSAGGASHGSHFAYDSSNDRIASAPASPTGLGPMHHRSSAANVKRMYALVDAARYDAVIRHGFPAEPVTALHDTVFPLDVHGATLSWPLTDMEVTEPSGRSNYRVGPKGGSFIATVIVCDVALGNTLTLQGPPPPSSQLLQLADERPIHSVRYHHGTRDEGVAILQRTQILPTAALLVRFDLNAVACSRHPQRPAVSSAPGANEDVARLCAGIPPKMRLEASQLAAMCAECLIREVLQASQVAAVRAMEMQHQQPPQPQPAPERSPPRPLPFDPPSAIPGSPRRRPPNASPLFATNEVESQVSSSGMSHPGSNSLSSSNSGYPRSDRVARPHQARAHPHPQQSTPRQAPQSRTNSPGPGYRPSASVPSAPQLQQGDGPVELTGMLREGWRMFRAGQPARAADCWLSVYEAAPDTAVGLEALGIVTEVVDRDYVSAIDLYRRALQADPRAATAMFKLAHLLETRGGDPQEAVALFDQAHRLGDDASGRRADALRKRLIGAHR